MIRFLYDPESVAFVDASIERFAQSRNTQAITRIQQYQNQLEELCWIEARRLLSSDELYSRLFPLPILDLDDIIELLGFDNELIRQPVPLNSLAVISVLFDLMISPQRNFRCAQKIFSEAINKDIELRDERDRPLFNDEIAKTATVEELLFFDLFNLFIQDHKSLLADSAPRRPRTHRPTNVLQYFEDLFDFAAHEAARPMVKRIQGEADGRSK